MSPELRLALILSSTALAAGCSGRDNTPRPTQTPTPTSTPDVHFGVSPDRSTITLRDDTDIGEIANRFVELGYTNDPLACSTGMTQNPDNQAYLEPIEINGIDVYQVKSMTTLETDPSCFNLVETPAQSPRSSVLEIFDDAKSTQQAAVTQTAVAAPTSIAATVVAEYNRQLNEQRTIILRQQQTESVKKLVIPGSVIALGLLALAAFRSYRSRTSTNTSTISNSNIITSGRKPPESPIDTTKYVKTHGNLLVAGNGPISNKTLDIVDLLSDKLTESTGASTPLLINKAFLHGQSITFHGCAETSEDANIIASNLRTSNPFGSDGKFKLSTSIQVNDDQLHIHLSPQG
jgi:hypothetical protein